MGYSKAYFEKQFNSYSDRFGNSWGMNWRAYMKLKNEKTLRELKKIIKEYPYGIYLETGCASGDFTEQILEAITVSGQYIGIDISDTAVSICEKRFQNCSNVRFLAMALPDIPSEFLYDGIICMDVFEYFDDAVQAECLRNFQRALKKGGKLVIQVPLPAVNEENLISLIKKEFSAQAIETVAYAYGQWCAKWFEYKLTYVATKLFHNRRLGWFGVPFGWIAYQICANEKLIRFFFALNERFAPDIKSHLTIVARKD